MKLLYITNQICGSGGLERVLSIKTKYLIDYFQYSIDIITLNQVNQPCFFDFSSAIKIHDITVQGSSFTYINGYISGIKKIVKSIKPDIVLVCDDGLKGFFVPSFLNNNCPIIYERHVSKQIMFNKNDSILQKLKINFSVLAMNLLAKTFDKFIVLTNDNIAEWNAKNIEVIPNPMTFYPDQTSSLQSKSVIAVGKQSYQKGYDRLLKSWQIVNKENPDWTLKIYGKPDESQGLEKLANELNIQQSLLFFDADKNIEQRYIEASIFVLSSRYEGFGMVIIEAMACGLPAISFDCPCGPKDIISNEIDGFLVENNNIEQFASKINILIKNENLRQLMGKNARENVKRFSPKIVMNNWDKLFKTLAN